MSPLSPALASSVGTGGPHRPVTTRLLLLVGLVLTAVVAAVLPQGFAAPSPSVSNPSDTYWSENGKCYVNSTAATGLSGSAAQTFSTSMDSLLAGSNKSATFTFVNGIVSATAEATCPAGVGSPTKKILETWAAPALESLLGIVTAIGLSLSAVTAAEAFGLEILDRSEKARIIRAFAGALSTGLRASYSGVEWRPTLVASIKSLFTSYAVENLGFRQLQYLLKDYAVEAFTFLSVVAASLDHYFRSTKNEVREAAEESLAQIRA